MRLRLTALLLLHAPALAGETVSTRVDGYDDGWVTVVMPMAEIEVEREKFTMTTSGSVDVLSGATPLVVADTVTSATPFDEVRGAGALEVELHPKATWSVTAGLSHSRESDDRSETASFTAAGEALDRLARWSVGVSETVRDTTQAGGGAAHMRSTSTGVSGRWVQILSKSTVAGALVGVSVDQCGTEWGCQGNPYRFVPLVDGGDVALTVPEKHPRQRRRGAATLRLSQAFGAAAALHLRYRLYSDSWLVTGHTVKLGAAWEGLGERLLLRADVRGATQSGASFYLDSYATDAAAPVLPALRTGDRELSGLRDLMVSAKAAWTLYDVGPFLRLRLTARVARLWFAYPNFSELPTRRAWVVGGGVLVER